MIGWVHRLQSTALFAKRSALNETRGPDTVPNGHYHANCATAGNYEYALFLVANFTTKDTGQTGNGTHKRRTRDTSTSRKQRPFLRVGTLSYGRGPLGPNVASALRARDGVGNGSSMPTR